MQLPTPAAVGRLVHARALKELAESLRSSVAASASGLWGSSVALATAALEEHLKRPILLVCGHIDEADDLADDMELFHGRRPEILPALELSGTLGQVSEEQASNRLTLLNQMAGGAPSTLYVASIQALMQSVPSKSQLSQLIRTIKPGDQLEPEKLIVWLSEHGYNRLDQIEVPGDFAVRGGIIDVYVPGEHVESPDQVGLTARIDFFGDQIESIKAFDLDSLGSKGKLDSISLLDLKGQLPETGKSTNFFSYLPNDTIIVLWAPLEIAEQSKSYFDRLPEVKGIYPLRAVLENASSFTRLELSQFGESALALPDKINGLPTPKHRLPITSLQKFETEPKKAIAELAELATTHDVTVLCENAGEEQRLGELLDQDQPGLRGRLEVCVGYLHRGFVYEEGRPLAILGHHELFHRYEQRRKVKKVINSRPVDSFLDLKVGDYVVHVAHGIAKFTGIQTIAKEGKQEEYLTLRFADNASLHVPASRINLIQKYIGGFHGHPRLSRLGSGAWEKEKAKVAEAVMDMAAELIDIQAARAAEPGVAFPPDTEWQKEFEAEFPYEPTPDQIVGADEIKTDMTKPRPMDRLLCGDVGYGKTELAMRAAFKAVEYGKQVAILVPTTVLAEQHYRSFKERMVNYPFAVDSISRFKSTKESKQILKDLAAGQVDILIGTHRLLSQDVKFADLGLVIVDEEQRFGVTHKERLKQMRKQVDVLTMSATPIPRTLHMSMLGLRDISSLTTAPQDRRSVVTEVMPFDKQRVKLAIERELNREGQIYFVHNRISNIIEIAEIVQNLVPTARIIVAHGQMEGDEMEQAMVKFINHEVDILVSTTIIESGLDIPNANTIFINQADRFGLSELHQLRGRVGRWKHRAYCYLLLPADRPVTPVAAKRLKAIEEYSHLGAGFKIAMRDLELRGAGNILGPEQSGHIATVGYEMYCQLLEEATRQLKNDPKPTLPEAHVEIGLSAFIPKSWIAGDRQRLDAYRRMSRCTSVETVAELLADFKDAFGDPPKQVMVLSALTELRLLAGHYGVESIIKQPPDVILKLRDAQRVQQALTGAPGSLRIVDEKTLYFRPPQGYLEPEVLLMVLRNLMYNAYQREIKGEAAPTPKPQPVAPPKPQPVAPAPPVAKPKPAPASEPATPRLSRRSEAGFSKPSPKPVPPPPQKPKETGPLVPELEKLVSLRNAGILNEEEFQAATKRLMAKAQ
jgi:transcription-repair coupling factor (superfamily II helicase)